MPSYSVDGKMALAANVTPLVYQATVTLPRRTSMYDLLIGSTSAAADASAELHIQRVTGAVGVGTAVTPRSHDPADAASVADALEILTTEPTYTADLVMLSVPFHQRGTPRWIARHDSAMFVSPAVDGEGFGLLCVTVNTVFTIGATIQFIE